MPSLRDFLPGPGDWTHARLSDCCTIVSRGKAPTYVERSPVRAIGQRCVTDTDFAVESARPHDPKRVTGMLVAQDADVLLNSTGTGTIGRSCLFRHPSTFVIDGHVTVLRADRSAVEPTWLNSLLRHPAGQLFLETQCYSGSTNQVELSRTRLSNSVVPLPPLPEQRRIAEILDTVDDAIRRTEEVIAKLQQVKQGLLHDLLTRGIDDNGELRDPDRHPEQFHDTPLGRLPRVWQLVPLSEMASVERGKFTYRPRNDPRYYGGPYPFIQTGDVAAAQGDVLRRFSQTLNALGLRGSRSFPAGTIAVTIAANIADTAILERSMCFPDSVVGVVVETPHSVRWVELCIRRAKTRLEARAPQSAQKNINLQDLRPLLIPLPAQDEQERVEQCYERTEARLACEAQGLDKLRLLKSGLMDDLLTGRVRVTVPAEEAQA